jgi:selenocysteine lyase/cysteine desulfurase
VRLRRLGVEIRVLHHVNWEVPTRAMIDAIDRRTRVVAISQVSYLTGVRHDIESISAAAHSRGALLLMDSSHAAGVVPVPASLADFTTFCCYKFMLAVHGIGVCVWNRARLPAWTPLEVGWASAVGHAPIESRLVYKLKDDAGRIEVGNPSVIGAHILGNSTAYLLGCGIGEIETHVLRLGALLRDALARLGVEVMTPIDPMRRAANICFRVEHADALRRELEHDGVLVWADEGRIRCSLHGYVDDEDVDRCVRAVKRALQR